VEGEHIVRLVRRGYKSWGGRHTVLGGSEEVIRQGLAPLPGFERLEGLGVQLADAARSERYPRVADELMDWMGVDRVFLMQAGTSEAGLEVRAFCYDRQMKKRVKAQKKVFDTGDPSFDEMVNLFCTALYMDVSGQVIAGTVQSTGGETGTPVLRKEEDGDSSGSSWWLWTAIGVVAAGGVGLALYFILGAGGEPGEGEVIFRF
jgi:hypothetical protein